ncbi:MAG: glycosyltransferase 87 family protein, partial [Thermoleophilia bacterium]|nr:glycosyltransferase 87 family protein [Thermoleophilia bacterium]
MTYAGTARRARRALWLGWPIGVLVWAAWVASVALGGGLRDAIGNVVGADHLAFYTAARLTLEGRPERMYDFADPWFSAYQNEILGGGWDSVMAYRNPPFYALLYLSTAWLPFVASLWIWVGIGLVALYLGLRWLRSSSPRLAFLWALTFFPVFSAVN